MAMVANVKEYFDTLDQRFVAEAAQGVDAVIQWELSGEESGTWHVVLANGDMDLQHGEHPSPTTTMKMKGCDYVNMVNGRLPGPMAFMTGKLKVSGNIPMAQKLKSIFPQG